MTLPDYIDNEQHKLQGILQELILGDNQRDLDIATGFFRIEAWIRLEESFNALTNLRLLIGRDPAIQAAERDRIDLQRHFRREVQGQLENEPYNQEYKGCIDRLISYLQQNHIQARLYGAVGERTPFLHAKAYIFNDYSIIGSSNFTPSGLQGNTELNVLIKQGAVARDLRQNWFEKFWNDPSVDIDYKAKLIDTLNKSKFGSKPYTPYQIFVKALYELFKEDSATEGTNERTSLQLATFQEEGYTRAVRLLERHQAVIIADAVGLGKTFIGLRLIDHYLLKDKQPGYVPRAVIICPAQLRSLVWNKKLDEFGIKADTISQEELGRNNFDIKKFSRYDLVVIDESHNFRNPNTNRYRNIQRLIGSGKRNKRVVLLTATPINNTIYDLYNQLMLLTRNNDMYYRDWGISNLKTYFKNLDKGNVEITELLMQVMVRRSRQDVIKRQQAGEQIFIGNKEIRFPSRQLEQFTYNFEESFQGLYSNLAIQIESLQLAPYNLQAFRKLPSKAAEKTELHREIQRNEAIVALMKSLFLKRMESSLVAFENSIFRQQRFQQEFQATLQQGRLLDSTTFRKILAAETDEEDYISVKELMESLPTVDSKEYHVDQLERQILEDFHALEDMMTKLKTIRLSVEKGQEYDRKLSAFKGLAYNRLKNQKIIVFSYFKDTAQYLYDELKKDATWLVTMGSPRIDLITGDTPTKQRTEKVKYFAPRVNCESDEERLEYQKNEIDILISTDVLSEGQNLQDAGTLVNYDLHWNPVRMIQRAGRIDRLGTEFKELFIYNCFPEQGLEQLLGLMGRLQSRIALIDREIGLDSSVLGEIISNRSLEDLRRLKEADQDQEKAAILAELEQMSELVSLDEMRFPLLEFINQAGREAAEEIPLGIHSIYHKCPQQHPGGGIFIAFRTQQRHFWYFYPCKAGKIDTEKEPLIEKRQIFKWLQCQANDFKHPDQLPPASFDNSIFPILEKATAHLLNSFKRHRNSLSLRPKLSKLLQSIYYSLAQQDLFKDRSIDKETVDRIIKIITTNPSLRTYERFIRPLWEGYKSDQNLLLLITNLDELFIEQDLYSHLGEIEEEESSAFDLIQENDIKLVCYQWFTPH